MMYTCSYKVIFQFRTVPCMDKRCQKVESFNINLCLTLCIDNIAVDDDAVSLCVSSKLLVK